MLQKKRLDQMQETMEDTEEMTIGAMRKEYRKRVKEKLQSIVKSPGESMEMISIREDLKSSILQNYPS
jgi:hypothetical protein